MKIGLVAPIWFAIPPSGYGGIELVVSLLADGLTDMGHDVTLFASGDSKTKARLVSSFASAPSDKIGQVYPDLIHSLNVYAGGNEFDIIHDHSGMIGPSIGAFVGAPVLHTLHGPATQDAKRLYEKLNFGLYYNAISDYQRRQFGDLNFVGTVYNAVEMDHYPYSEQKEDFLLFLGRMNPEKGAHLAVAVAERAKKPLVMVTKMREPAEREYFEACVKPHIKGDVEILGEIDPKLKAEYFARAYCTLFPIQWPEPFGLVMIESMAAGTPVVAFRNGAVPEVLEDGKTGFIVDTVEEMVARIDDAGKIVPATCRHEAEERFSHRRLVRDYAALYEQIVEKHSRQNAA